MKIEKLMTTDVITVSPDAALKEAARRMVEGGISGLVVTDDGGAIVGVITEADFVAAEAGRRAPKRAGLLSRWFGENHEHDVERRVADVMTTDVVTLAPGDDHAEAARVMQRAGIKRIPIVGGDGRLAGIVSRGDILRAFTRPDASIIDEIADHVMREVLWLDPRMVRITCEDGNVELSGRLENKSDVQLLVELTRRLDGVASVKDHLSWSYDNTKLEVVTPRPGLNW